MDKGEEKKIASQLLTDEERCNIVRSFIDAYIRGTIKLWFPTKEELEEGGHKEALQLELATKQRFVSLVQIATGTVKATQSEVEKSPQPLFKGEKRQWH